VPRGRSAPAKNEALAVGNRQRAALLFLGLVLGWVVFVMEWPLPG
jgi:hypothetical protein